MALYWCLQAKNKDSTALSPVQTAEVLYCPYFLLAWGPEKRDSTALSLSRLQKCCTVPIFGLQVPIKCGTVPKKPKKPIFPALPALEPAVVPKRLVF